MKTAKQENDRIIYGVNVVIKEKISKKGTPYTVAVFADDTGETLFTTLEKNVVQQLLLLYYTKGGAQ